MTRGKKKTTPTNATTPSDPSPEDPNAAWGGVKAVWTDADRKEVRVTFPDGTVAIVPADPNNKDYASLVDLKVPLGTARR